MRCTAMRLGRWITFAMGIGVRVFAWGTHWVGRAIYLRIPWAGLTYETAFLLLRDPGFLSRFIRYTMLLSFIPCFRGYPGLG